MPTISRFFPSAVAQGPDDSPAWRRQVDGEGEAGSTFRDVMAQSLRKTSLNGLRTDSHHLPLFDRNTVDEGFEMRAMDILAERQQVIASNIANADTPNYKARDVDLQGAMREAQIHQAPPLSLAATSASHLARSAQRTAQALALKYQVPGQGSVDGNTVEMDTERAKFAENGLRLKFSLDQATDREMLQLLSKLKG